MKVGVGIPQLVEVVRRTIVAMGWRIGRLGTHQCSSRSPWAPLENYSSSVADRVSAVMSVGSSQDPFGIL